LIKSTTAWYFLGQLEELYRALEEVILALPKYGAFEITVSEAEKVPQVMALVNAIGEVLDVEYGEKTRIRAYVQTGMIRELTRLGVGIERLDQPHQREGLEDGE